MDFLVHLVEAGRFKKMQTEEMQQISRMMDLGFGLGNLHHECEFGSS